MTDQLLDSNKFLSKEEYEYLVARLNRDRSRDSTMLLLLATYGMRAGELLAMQLKDINFKTKSIVIYGSKGSRSREFPLTADLFKRLRSQCNLTCIDQLDRVFPIRYNRLGEIWRMWRPSDKPLHCLRHSAAVRIYQETKDIQLVQKILGHKYISNTMIYQQFSYNQEKFKEVFGA